MSYWKNWKYKNLTFVFISLIFALILSKVGIFHYFLIHLGSFGYIGAFIAGFLFVSTFTVATGGLILFILAEQLNPVEIGLIAGLGAVAGDLTIFKLVKDNLASELAQIYNKIDHNHHFVKLLHTKYFNWSLPVLGAILIASPLPDEIGITLMGISKLTTFKFILISFLLNSSGIFLIVSTSVILNP